MKKGTKNNLKKLFCTVLMVSVVLTTLPLGRVGISAAQKDPALRWISNIKDASNCIQVEEGKRFYLGDYIHTKEFIDYGTLDLTASMLKEAAYSSSDESVASVDAQTGCVETKKEGTAILTCTHNGKMKTCTLRVEPAGSLTEGLEKDVKKKIKKVEKQLAKVLAVMEEEVTVSNGYDMWEAYLNYRSFVRKKTMREVITGDGFLSSECRLVVPLAGRAWTLNCMLRQYEYYYLPKDLFNSGYGDHKWIPIDSISATPKRITIKAEEKMTAEQILALQMKALYPEDLIGRDKAKYYEFAVFDTNTRDVYEANCIFTKGSRLIKCNITFKRYVYDKPGKLKKGHTYRVGYNDEWPWGDKVTVK